MSEQFLTREQRYASAVYKAVEKYLQDRTANATAEIKNEPSKDPEIKAYGALAHKLPILIRTAGLAQALVFVKSRNVTNNDNKQTPAKTARNRLIQDLNIILKNKDLAILDKNQDLLGEALKAPFDEYMRLTEACMESLLWFKRFATSELGVEQGMEGEDE